MSDINPEQLEKITELIRSETQDLHKKVKKFDDIIDLSNKTGGNILEAIKLSLHG